MALKIAVLIGSNRPTRAGDKVAKWFMEQVADTHDVTFDLIDLAEVDLPLLNEPKSPKAGDYVHEHTINWGKKIAGYDGYVWVVAEYNHGYTAILKNAIDTLHAEWGKKPVAFVGYGVLGAARAIEQLVQVAAQLEMVPIPSATVNVIEIWAAFGEDGEANGPLFKGDPKHLVEKLVWWAQALKMARS